MMSENEDRSPVDRHQPTMGHCCCNLEYLNFSVLWLMDCSGIPGKQQVVCV